MLDSNLMENLIQNSKTSQILSWEVYNFAQFEYAKAEFDESNILMLKGANSAGKSNLQFALSLALTNMYVTKQRVFIKRGETEAKVVINMSDGVRVEFIMMLSSLSKKARYSNGYRMFYNGEEIWTSLVDKKSGVLKEVPPYVSRYFNLAQVDEGIINVMDENNGLILKNQSAMSIRKTLSQITQSDNVDRAIKRLKEDNKEGYRQLIGAESRIGLHLESLDAYNHITEEVVESLEVLSEKNSELETLTSILSEITDGLGVVSELPSGVYVESVDLDNMALLNDLGNLIEYANDTPTLYELPVIESENFNLLDDLKENISDLNKLELGIECSACDTSKLDLFWSMHQLLNGVSKYESLPLLSDLDDSSLLDLISLGKLIKGLVSVKKDWVALTQENKVLIEGIEENSNKLKILGHPLVKCTNCNELTVGGEYHVHG